MSELTPVLTAQGVAKRFCQSEAQIAVLNGVELTLSAGERVAIVGRSGSGKSTLLHVLAGLDDADAGSVTVVGETMTPASSEVRTGLRRRHMGFVYQQHHLLSEFTALENVAMPLRLNGLSQPEAEQRSAALLTRVGLARRLHHLPSELSGGERQRVAVARALIHAPSVVLADEPTGNLDSASARELMSLMVDLSESVAVGFLVVTHDPSMLDHFDRVLTLVDGKLLELPREERN
ncbi:MAG: ATP-binding cassette domain-containing protein [Proteobacteria bacterium]|nr:ATP-binding cassette domain-containing protein [Pseudomonadota bacterium]